MKNPRPLRLKTAFVISTGLILCWAFPAKAQRTYSVTDVGFVAGAVETLPGDINNRGEIAVASFLAFFPTLDTVGFVVQDGNMIFLPTLGGLYSLPSGINELGEVTGSANFAGDTIAHAVIWDKSLEHVTDLGTLGGPTSEAFWLNVRGEAVGSSVIANGIDTHAFLWNGKNMVDLLTLGGNNSLAYVINDSGFIVGQSDITTALDPTFGIPQFHGFLWARGHIKGLGEIFGGHFNTATGINDRGEIVGAADLAGDLAGHAFIIQDGLLTDLGTVPGDTNSGAANLNNRGQVVGISGSVAQGIPPASAYVCPCHATLWENGKATDLNTVIPPDSGWQLQGAVAISDRGQIVGVGIVSSDPLNTHGFLLTPQEATSPSATAANENRVAAPSQSSAANAPAMRVTIVHGRPQITIEH
jgi:probable HAF family extracellular repeat protein